MMRGSGKLLTAAATVHGANLAALFALVLLFVVAAASALDTSSTEPATLLQSLYLEDRDRELSAQQALEKLREGRGNPMPGGRFNLANYDSHFWLYLRVANTSDKSPVPVPTSHTRVDFQLRGVSNRYSASAELAGHKTAP